MTKWRTIWLLATTFWLAELGFDLKRHGLGAATTMVDIALVVFSAFFYWVESREKRG